MANVVTGDDIERLIRKLLGGNMEDRPGKPALDKRDVYMRLMRVERFYPKNRKVAVIPFLREGDPDAQPIIIDVACPSPVGDGGLMFIPSGETGKCPITGWDSIKPPECYALVMSVGGDPYRKGAFVLGFTSLLDLLYEEDRPGLYLSFGDAIIRMGFDDKGKSVIELNADSIIVNGKKL